jgi:hypothetical protein
MTRPSSPEHPWAVLMHVLDDDDRTHRAERLMSYVTMEADAPEAWWQELTRTSR